MGWAQEARPPNQERGLPLTLQTPKEHIRFKTTSHNTAQPHMSNCKPLQTTVYTEPISFPNTIPIASNQGPATVNQTEAPLRIHWNQGIKRLTQKIGTQTKPQHYRWARNRASATILFLPLMWLMSGWYGCRNNANRINHWFGFCNDRKKVRGLWSVCTTNEHLDPT